MIRLRSDKLDEKSEEVGRNWRRREAATEKQCAVFRQEDPWRPTSASFSSPFRQPEEESVCGNSFYGLEVCRGCLNAVGRC